MNTTYKQQIKAIQRARNLLYLSKELDSALNDAGATIASLNLSDPYKEIERLRNELEFIKAQLKNAQNILAHYADVNQNQ